MPRPFTFKHLALSVLLAGSTLSAFAAGPMVKTCLLYTSDAADE